MLLISINDCLILARAIKWNNRLIFILIFAGDSSYRKGWQPWNILKDYDEEKKEEKNSYVYEVNVTTSPLERTLYKFIYKSHN